MTVRIARFDQPGRALPHDRQSGRASRHPSAHPPAWASAYGDDRHGLWADIVVERFYLPATQRLRWIEPGEFWMGSPIDEPHRDVDEGPRHRVRLQRGYWLADTPCTQRMWATLRGDEPSLNQRSQQGPVENVSWDDVQFFLRVLQDLLTAGTVAALPTEAQWEYACRAGADSAFSNGDSISVTQANFDGKLPYRGEPQTARGETVPVCSYRPNAWGLYDMHGNVWEWCADGLRSYAGRDDGEVVIDPVGTTADTLDASRVVRGGSWQDGARFLRSANRFSDRRSWKGDNVGFRFALLPA